MDNSPQDPLTERELKDWLEDPVTRRVLLKLAEQFPAEGWKRSSMEAIQGMQGEQRVLDFLKAIHTKL